MIELNFSRQKFFEVLFVLYIFSVLCDMSHTYRTIRTSLVSYIRSSFREKPHLLDVSIIKRRCMPNDLDIFMHMNNGNYLKHCDIGRLQLWIETGIWKYVRSKKATMVAGASNNRYRKAITVFQSYIMTSRVIYWDESAFYVEHRFIRCSDNFICFISLIKQTVVGLTPDQLIQSLDYQVEKPELLPELEKWIESISISSERLRKAS